MKQAELTELARNTEGLIAASQTERVIITSEGRPVAVVVGIEGKDEEDMELERSPEFWRMIQERRQMPGIPWEEAKKRLFPEEENEVKRT